MVLDGTIDRITYNNPENGFSVLQVRPENGVLVTVTGCAAAIHVGHRVHAEGTWEHHPEHGWRLLAKTLHITPPLTCEDLKRYLAASALKGVGPELAHRIVTTFGTETLTILDTQPQQLRNVPGIGAKKLTSIVEQWENQKNNRSLTLTLTKFGLSPALGKKILAVYGKKTAQILSQEPYRLCHDIAGIGFKTADKIAQSAGIEPQNPQRIAAAAAYFLKQAAEEGHTCYPYTNMLTALSELLTLETTLLQEALDAQQEDMLIKEPLPWDGVWHDFVWLKQLYIAERGIAKELHRIQWGEKRVTVSHPKEAQAWGEKHIGFHLAAQQQQALAYGLQEKILILTGGPGTGKSSITQVLTAIFQKARYQIALCAPTGKAAKRLSELNTMDAKTIHQLLEFDFRNGGFKRNRQFPLEEDVFIIDEASMIDTRLFYSLLRAIPDHAKVIIIGDVHQLPSIGPGACLFDLIFSRQWPVVKLTEVFRQSATSHISVHAHQLLKGIAPTPTHQEQSDFFFVERNNPETIVATLLGLMCERIPRTFALDPFQHIQILTPMKKGPVGTERLNALLQTTLLPERTPLPHPFHNYRVGDKVMQIKNDYKKGIFNGDQGRVTHYDRQASQLHVVYPDRGLQMYDRKDCDHLILSYAVSIHKYQGSEVPCVIIPVHKSHAALLHRQLLYTAITRGKKLVIVVGSKEAVQFAAQNSRAQKRYTGLWARLMGEAVSLLPRKNSTNTLENCVAERGNKGETEGG